MLGGGDPVKARSGCQARKSVIQDTDLLPYTPTRPAVFLDCGPFLCTDFLWLLFQNNPLQWVQGETKSSWSPLCWRSLQNVVVVKTPKVVFPLPLVGGRETRWVGGPGEGSAVLLFTNLGEVQS